MEFDEEETFKRFWKDFLFYRNRIDARYMRGSSQSASRRKQVQAVLDAGYHDSKGQLSPDGADFYLDHIKRTDNYIFEVHYMSGFGGVASETWLPVGDDFYVVDRNDELIKVKRDDVERYLRRQLTGTHIEIFTYRNRGYSIDSIDQYLS